MSTPAVAHCDMLGAGVQRIMVKNIDQVLERGDQLDGTLSSTYLCPLDGWNKSLCHNSWRRIAAVC